MKKENIFQSQFRDKKLTKEQKRIITQGVRKVVKEYGEVLHRLGKE